MSERKGRLDETFFIDLPSDNAREQIFKVHRGKRKLLDTDFDLPIWVKNTRGFSGAKIEQAIVSAGFAAVSAKKTPTTLYILTKISNTKPLAVLTKENIDWTT